MKRNIILIFFLSLIIPSIYAQIVKEKRVYYLDCSYSMVSPNKIWESTKINLRDAIEHIEDETTEIVLIPFAFDTKHHDRLDGITVLANTDGKNKIFEYIDCLPKPDIHTKTFHSDPMDDFFKYRVVEDKVTYMFLMTDGEDEDLEGIFNGKLNEWGLRFGDKDVYGFYVMLDKKAHKKQIIDLIDKTPHLWQVDDANVSVNPVRLQNKVVFNARNDKYIDINIYGNKTEGTIDLSFGEGLPYRILKTEIIDDKLRAYIGFDCDIYSLPATQDCLLNATMNGGGEYDFLVTDKLNIRCDSKPEKSLKVSIR